MNKLLKISVSIAIALIGLNAFAQNSPRINNRTDVSINGVNSFTVRFSVSGCASGYDWSATNALGQNFDLADSWDVAFGAPATTEVSTVPLGNLPGGLWLTDPKSTYEYSVKCLNAIGPNDPKATVKIYVLPQPVSEFVPAVKTLTRECASLETGAAGVVRLQAVGCYDEVEWTKPDGTTEIVWEEFDGILTLNGNYQEGNYSAKCKFNQIYQDANYNLVNSFPVSKSGNLVVTKEYFPPRNITLTSSSALGNGWTEICEGVSIKLNTTLPESYIDKLSFQWFYNNTSIEGNRTGFINRGNTGNYFVRVSSKGGAGVCGFSDSNIFTINKIILNKPVILGNSNYCLDGVTNLSVDSVKLVKQEGYLMPTKPTAPDKFTWYFNGIAQSNLGTLSMIKVNSNVSVQVSYISNYGCNSPISDALAVTNYERPATPTITAKSKLGFCFGTPIAGVLESSALPGGIETKYEWSNKLTTKVVNVDKAGIYTVRTITPEGCFSLNSAPVEIVVLPLPAAPTIATLNGASPFFCAKSESGTLNSVSLVATTTNDVIWSTRFEGKVLADVRTSGTYTATARDVNGCISLNSNSIKVVAQANPALGSDTKILKEGVYTLKATNFPSAATVNATGGGEYVWKYGSTVLAPKTFITKVKSAGEYSVARKYLYTIDGTPLTCITDPVRYNYTVDPDFSGVAVYPNPITTGNDLTAKVQIQILEDWTNGDIMLYDMVGRPVYAGKIANTDGTVVIDVTSLANGIYVLQIKADAGKSFVGKVIVNK